jgi:signal transduction histidine kinase
MELDGKQILQGVIRDISARKKNEVALVAAKEEAEVANKAKSAFISVMSHELRTPLTGILGMTELLQMTQLDKDQREFSDTVIDCGNSLLRIINDIINYSNIERGVLKLNAKSCDIGLLIQECVAMEAHRAQSKGLEMTASCSIPAHSQYSIDTDHMKSMLLHLIDNAIKFTTHGFVKIDARIMKTNGHFHELEISVSDSGIGIAADKQITLIRPFFQLDNSNNRAYGGMGIGLSIVSSLSRLMGGETSVESELEKGSRFWFSIQAEVLDK